MSERVLMTRVECLCGASAAIPEAGFFPLCGRCGRRMVAPDEGRICYVSEPLTYAQAVEQQAAEPGMQSYHGHRRVYRDEALTEVLAERGWPTEPQTWPLLPSADGGSYPVPPWELEGARA